MICWGSSVTVKKVRLIPLDFVEKVGFIPLDFDKNVWFIPLDFDKKVGFIPLDFVIGSEFILYICNVKGNVYVYQKVDR